MIKYKSYQEKTPLVAGRVKFAKLGGSGRRVHQLPQVNARQALQRLLTLFGQYHVVMEVPGGHSIRLSLPHQLLHGRHQQRPVQVRPLLLLHFLPLLCSLRCLISPPPDFLN
ncbi:hypothetical protein NL676_035764 [Syzygium grande]|nr:hypothetical protein NL676_035764 [Syzygium grande]